MTIINPIDISGVKFTVTVSDDGQFQAVYKSETFVAYSKGELREKLETAIKRDRMRISVPFTRLSRDGRAVACEVTGKHFGNGNWLVNVGSKAGEQEHWLDRTALRPLDADERAEIRRLLEARTAAQAAVDEFTGARQFELRAAVDEAWAEAGK